MSLLGASMEGNGGKTLYVRVWCRGFDECWEFGGVAKPPKSADGQLTVVDGDGEVTAFPMEHVVAVSYQEE